MIAAIEGGTHCQIVSSGLAAVTTAAARFSQGGRALPDAGQRLRPGTQLLRPGPLRDYGDRDDLLSLRASPRPSIAALIRANTTVVFMESPGSHTFEVQDVPALARAAHARGAKVLMDNTWGLHFFQPFRHGVDVSIQALTKYAGGPFGRAARQHHDEQRGRLAARAGHRAGARPVRQPGRLLARAARSAYASRAAAAADGSGTRGGALARPAGPRYGRYCTLPCPARPATSYGSATSRAPAASSAWCFSPASARRRRTRWSRRWSYSGSARPGAATRAWPCRRPDSSPGLPGSGDFGGPVVRFHIGLEDTEDLVGDLERGLEAMRAFRPACADPE